MEPVLEQCTLVLVGAWNRAIFTPLWVSERIFRRDVQVEVAFGPLLQMRMRTEQAELMLVSDRLQLRPLAGDDEAFERVHEAARRALECLPETPVAALGVNYTFEDRLLRPALAELAELARGPVLPTGVTSPVQLRMSAPGPEGTTVNLRLDIEAERAEVEVNFHLAVENAAAASRALERAPHRTLSPEALRWASKMLRYPAGAGASG